MPDDYSDVLGNEYQTAAPSVVGTINDNPDHAAEALHLSKATGAPPSFIFNDLDGFKSAAKQGQALGIINANPRVASFVSDPMAARVSNDDLGQLDVVSQHVGKHDDPGIWERLGRGYTAAKTALLENVTSPEYLEEEQKVRNYVDSPVWRGFAQNLIAAGAGVNILASAPGAAIEGVVAAAGGDGRLRGDLNTLMLAAGDPHFLPTHAVPKEFNDLAVAAKRSKEAAAPFLEAGRPPPVGIDPVIDAGHLAENQADLEKLREGLKEAVGSKTRERAPSMFVDFIHQHTGDKTIGITSDAVREMYGSEVPHPEDGKLGFVPDLPSQLLQSTVTGRDIQIRLDDYYTHMDPAVAKQLEPFTRTRSEGITQVEADALAQKTGEITAYHRTRPDQFDPNTYFSVAEALRQTAGVDRPNPTEEAPHFFITDRANPNYHFTDETGGKIFLRGGDDASGKFVGEYANVGEAEPLGKVIQDLRAISGGNSMVEKSADMMSLTLAHLGRDKVPLYTVRPENPAVRGALGMYYPGSDAVVLRHTGRDAQMLQTTTHEAGHAAYAAAIEKSPEAKSIINSMREEAREWFTNDQLEEHKDTFLYGLTDEHEFISEGNSRAEFQEILSKIKPSPELIEKVEAFLGESPKSKISSLWDVFLQVARKLFNVPEGQLSLLDYTFKVADRLTAMAEEGERGQGGQVRFQKDPAFDRAAALGMSPTQYVKLRDLIEKQAREDADSRTAEILREEKRRVSKEWEAARPGIRQEVTHTIQNLPEVRADAIVNKRGFDTEMLSEEQRAALPEKYHNRRGLDPDTVANEVGLDSGDELITRLAKHIADRGDTRPIEYTRKLISEVTEAELHRRFGDPAEAAIDAAKDRILTDTQMQILHLEAGGGVDLPVSLAEMKANVKEVVGEMPIRQISSDEAIASAGRAGREIMNAAPDDPRRVALSRVKQLNRLLAAREIKAVEKLKVSFDRLAKTYSKETVAGADQAYVNQMHAVMQRFGLPVRRPPEAILESMQSTGHSTLEKFVAEKAGDGRSIKYVEWLSGSDPVKIGDLTVNQFKDLNDFMKSMVFNARAERRVVVAGEAMDFSDLRDRMLDRVKETFPKIIPARPAGNIRAKDFLSAFKWAGLNAETILDRLDNFDREGVFTQAVSRLFTESSNSEARMLKEYNLRLADEVGNWPRLNKLIDNDLIIDPATRDNDPTHLSMNRQMVLGAVMNSGNADNLARLAQPYRVTKDQLWEFYRKHTTPEDWDRAQKIGSIFNELFAMANEMSLRISGVGIRRVQIEKFIDPFGIERDGWYNPIAHNGELGKDFNPQLAADMEALPRFSTQTVQSYAKARTGYRAPLELSFSIIPVRMRQMIHDINHREAVIQMNKIYKDPAISEAIKRRLGKAAFDELQSHLERMAGETDSPVRNLGIINRALNGLAGNFISTAVGLNPNTIIKHGMSAFAGSFQQTPLGFTAELSRMIAEVPIGSPSWKMAFEKSDALTHRSNTLGEMAQQWGQSVSLYRSGTATDFSDLRTVLQWAGSKPIAFFDHMSAVPLWLSSYRRSIAEGLSEGDAVYKADTLVRETHGSTLATNRPSIAASHNALVKNFGALYNYFSEKLQQTYKATAMIYNGLGLMKEGEILQGLTQVRKASGLIFFTNIVPALIDYMVYHNEEDKKADTLHTLLHLGALSVGAPFLLLRDMVGSLASGHDISAGPIGSSMKSIVDVGRDIIPDKHGKVAIANPQKVGRFLKHSATALGALTGLPNVQEGKAAQFLWDYSHGYVHPRNTWQMYIGLRNGTLKGHSRSFDDWVKLDLSLNKH